MAPEPEEETNEKNPLPLDEDDIALLKTYGLGPYSAGIKKVEKEIKEMAKKVNDLCGIKESDTGLAAPSQWDLVSDKQMMQEEQPLQVARCTKIINPNTEDAKYVINVKQIHKVYSLILMEMLDCIGLIYFMEPQSGRLKFISLLFTICGWLGCKVSPTDIEEGMRVGVDRNKYQIQIPLPPKIDPSVTMMTVEEKPDVTYNDVGGCKEQIEKMREVVELPMLHPEKFVKLGIDPPKGVLCYGPPGTGKTLLARAVANRTDACFIRVIGSELVQKYVGEGAWMTGCSKRACIVFFDEVDAICGARFDDGVGGDNEVQRTILEIVNQLDGFDARGNIKVLMATNRGLVYFSKLLTLPIGYVLNYGIKLVTRPDTLDPALVHPGRLDRADIRSVCTEAGMFAIRARRKTVTEKDFLDAVNKVDVLLPILEAFRILDVDYANLGWYASVFNGF
ncbi:26S proteasome regulatory subunit 7 [Cocos nucifera]|uniref:26S proteasome regulatory subunit 7 n=1 Tax=Cocos nucifera TaxID=13894 RepID=A0A8K0HX65_COCNU|nr:26S proteasome regulatory subunit 7 [Cocos nucifera]